MTPWKILVVDDEEGIHGITRMIFRDYEFEQRPIELISAMSGKEARAQLQQHPDIVLVLLDVVMETENEGLQLVDYIRNDLVNKDMRIILRTGHPGYAPEAQVIIQYDINDYLSKAELSASRLLTSVVVALRSWRDIRQAHEAAPLQEDESQQVELMQALAVQVQQQLSPVLRNSQRLMQLDLNPVARDLIATLHSQHLRLDHTIALLNSTVPVSSSQVSSPQQCLDQLLQIFLPQSRAEGWLIDYRIDSSVPETLPLATEHLMSVLVSCTELVLLQSGGHDLKISLICTAEQSLIIQTGLSSGQPVFDHSSWAQYLRLKLEQQCRYLNGTMTEIDEGGVIECNLVIKAV
ncbi:response regulator [Oceanospirillum sediminis]|uniref:Response regulator n=1 Tax=Oceanospirillum sediminis TaxID=2760088 RepID=A0A839IS86_9GAMM|nr:response regulator [Oceanospirillum sediminis]MBB1487838.1 response regulator [Oceanospirillum sediminis]